MVGFMDHNSLNYGDIFAKRSGIVSLISEINPICAETRSICKNNGYIKLKMATIKP